MTDDRFSNFEIEYTQLNTKNDFLNQGEIVSEQSRDEVMALDSFPSRRCHSVPQGFVANQVDDAASTFFWGVDEISVLPVLDLDADPSAVAADDGALPGCNGCNRQTTRRRRPRKVRP